MVNRFDISQDDSEEDPSLNDVDVHDSTSSIPQRGGNNQGEIELESESDNDLGHRIP